MSSTRGIRNCNPFNIKYNTRNKWVGKYYPPFKKDNTFEEFIDMEHGIRAMLVLISRYIKNGLTTPCAIIGIFAPSVENDLDAYLSYLKQFGIDVNKKICSLSQVFKLLIVMASFESHYSLTQKELSDICIKYNINFNFFNSK